MVNQKGGREAALLVVTNAYGIRSSLRANGSRERAPDDRLREAIHSGDRAPADCFVRFAPRNDVLRRFGIWIASLRSQ
jgi:hypothetical protein